MKQNEFFVDDRLDCRVSAIFRIATQLKVSDDEGPDFLTSSSRVDSRLTRVNHESHYRSAALAVGSSRRRAPARRREASGCLISPGLKAVGLRHVCKKEVIVAKPKRERRIERAPSRIRTFVAKRPNLSTE